MDIEEILEVINDVIKIRKEQNFPFCLVHIDVDWETSNITIISTNGYDETSALETPINSKNIFFGELLDDIRQFTRLIKIKITGGPDVFYDNSDTLSAVDSYIFEQDYEMCILSNLTGGDSMFGCGIDNIKSWIESIVNDNTNYREELGNWFNEDLPYIASNEWPMPRGIITEEEDIATTNMRVDMPDEENVIIEEIDVLISTAQKIRYKFDKLN